MRSIHRLCAAGMLAFAVGSPLAAADEARLTAAPLPTPQLTVGPGSEKADIDRTLGQLETGIKLTFKRGSSAGETITVAGTEVQLAIDGGKPVMSVAGKGGPLRMAGAMVAPTALPLPDGRKAALAFPSFQPSLKGDSFLYVTSAMAMKGSLAGTEIGLYDADLDGTYALGKDGYQVGKSLVFAPLTPHLSTGRKIYKSDSSGRSRHPVVQSLRCFG